MVRWHHPLEKEMAIHSSTLAWKIPWMEEPDRLQSMGSQRVGPKPHPHDSTLGESSREAQSGRRLLVHTYHYITPSESEVTQSCPTLCDPVDCSLSGSSIHGILQARILEWVAISFSRGSS